MRSQRRRQAWVWVLLGLWACSETPDTTSLLESFTQTSTPTPTTIQWYDAKPLLRSLRPDMHDALTQAIAPNTLADLPLYDMQLDLDLGSAHFALQQRLWWTNTTNEAVPDIAFRIFANTASTLSGKPPPVRYSKGRCPEDSGCVIEQPAVDVIVVRPSQPIAAGAHYRVELEVEGTLTRIDSSRTNMLAQGLEGMASMGSPHGHGDYGLLAIGDGVASLANFYPMLARRKHARWILGEESLLGDLGSDELAHARVQVTTDPGVEVIATGVNSERLVLPNGRTQVSIQAAAIREVAVLASRQLRPSSVMVGDVRVTSYYLPRDAAEGAQVLDYGARSLAVFQQRFGAYPYPELDLVEAAMIGGAGGVEFSGLVTIASMLYRPALDNAGGGLGAMLKAFNPAAASNTEGMRGAMLELVVAHEVAHQYWHVLVGNDCRDHPFDDEALAQHSAIVYLEDRYGAARASRDESVQVANGYRMMRAMNHPDGPVNRPVAAFGAPIEYAGLIYGKGPMVYRVLREQTGEDGFFEAIRAYVKAYRFKHTPPLGLIETIAARGRAEQVRRIARHWLEETHGDEDLGALDMGSITGATAATGDGAQAPVDGAAQALPGVDPNAASSGQINDMLRALGGGDGTQTGSRSNKLGYGTGLRGSGMFGNNGNTGFNGTPGVDPEMQEIMKQMPGLGGGADMQQLGPLLQQLQQLQQPSAEAP